MASLIRRAAENPNLRSQGTMHRTFVGDFHQSLALLGVQWTFHGNDPINLVEHARLGFAFRAIFTGLVHEFTA